MLKVKEENSIDDMFTLDIYKSCIEMSNMHEIGLNPDYVSSVAVQNLSIGGI